MRSLCRLPVAKKKTILGKFRHLGALVATPFTDEGQLNLVCYSRPTVYADMPNIVSIDYSVALCSRKTQTFALFWTSAFSGVANWQQSEKVEHRCTTTHLPLSNGIKIVSVLQKPSGAQTLTFKSVTNRQTDKQKTQRLWPPWRRVSQPRQTWHADRRLRARSCTSKTFGV